jgi:hypothetical protein
MHDQTRVRMRRWGLTLLSMWLLGGACAWAQDLGTAQLELLPPHPTPSDRLVIRLFGEWRNACVPGNPQLSITGSEVRIETTNPSEYCTQVISSWELFVSVGQLPVDAYQVLVIHTAGTGQPQPIGQAEFAVQPITGGSAIGMRLHAVLCVNQTTGHWVWVELGQDPTFWDCQGAGLAVHPGDVIDIIVHGSAE